MDASNMDWLCVGWLWSGEDYGIVKWKVSFHDCLIIVDGGQR